MKKLILALCLTIIILTGCTNPIASSVAKEGDKTRAEMQAELAIAKREIDNNIASVSAELGADLQRTQEMINAFYKFYIIRANVK